MSNDRTPKVTAPQKCAHCHHEVQLAIVAVHSQVSSHEQEYDGPIWRTPFQWDAGPIYEVLECPVCHGIALRSYIWHSEFLDEVPEYSQLYPRVSRTPHGLPPEIDQNLKMAMAVKNMDANLFAVQLGRVLELILHDLKAQGDTLHKKLSHLKTEGRIPSQLVDAAAGLRKLRNIGAHAKPGVSLTSAEAPVVESLCLAIIDYVYTGRNSCLWSRNA